MWEVGCLPHQAGVALGRPAAVSLGNDHRTERILKSGSRVRGAEWVNGATGTGQLGCLDCNSRHVVSYYLGQYHWTEGLYMLFPSCQTCPMTQLGQ